MLLCEGLRHLPVETRIFSNYVVEILVQCVCVSTHMKREYTSQKRSCPRVIVASVCTLDKRGLRLKCSVWKSSQPMRVPLW